MAHKHPAEAQFAMMRVAILKVSDSRTRKSDTTGPWLAKAVDEAGHVCVGRTVVPDDKYAIRAAVSDWVAKRTADAIITTGGTGITGRDGTPEAVAPLLDKEIDGFGEIFRQVSYRKIGLAAMQSRALAGVANGVFIFCLPGSSGACRDGWELIRPQLDLRTRPCNLAMLATRVLESPNRPASRRGAR